MSRKEARENAMKAIYQIDLMEDYEKSNVDKYLVEFELKDQKNYVLNVINAYLENRNEINKLIDTNSNNWKINRMPKIDLAILRLAISEIKYLEDIPKSVSINEAIELGKKYSTEESGKFINAILGKID